MTLSREKVVLEFLLIAALQQSATLPRPHEPEVIVAHEDFDRAPSTVSATYIFQCGENNATLIIQVPQALSQSGAKVSGQPNATAFLNGYPIDDGRNQALVEAIRSVAILPEVTPGCSSGKPFVTFRSSIWPDRSAIWQIIEGPSGE